MFWTLLHIFIDFAARTSLLCAVFRNGEFINS